nr:hypothetical protein [Klebsiella pneumoniae]WPT08370.1 hypothetical protein [Serratia marcescens]WPT08509.1 hypothetical protein [Serratia marcescens]WPT08648.1 hypothetical protein [Klebsiella pneumoniae]
MLHIVSQVPESENRNRTCPAGIPVDDPRFLLICARLRSR